MKILRFIFGTIASIVALAIATKLAALILGVLGFAVGVIFLILKASLVVAIALFLVWLVSRVMQSRRGSEGY